MNCPRDNAYLQKDFHKAIMIDVCPVCGGMFISLNELVNHFSVPDLEKLLKEKVDAAPASPFKCPRCDVLKTLSNSIDSTMHPVIVKNIEIDICGNCLGIWFDGGELEKIMPAAEYKKLMESGMDKGSTEAKGLLENARGKEVDILSHIAEAKPKSGPASTPAQSPKPLQENKEKKEAAPREAQATPKAKKGDQSGKKSLKRKKV